MFFIDPSKTFVEIDQQMAERIRVKFQNMGKVECLYELQKQANKWAVGETLTSSNVFAWALELYGIRNKDVPLVSNDEFNVQELLLRTNAMERESVSLFHTLRLHNLVSEEEVDDTVLTSDEEHDLRFRGIDITLIMNPVALLRCIKEIIEKQYYIRRLMSSFFHVSIVNDRRYQSSNTQEDLDDELNRIMHKFGWLERTGQMKAQQSLLLYLFDCAYEQRLMKLEEDQVCNVYIPNMEGGRYNRFAYQYLMTLEEWIMAQTGKEHEFSQWQNLTSSGGNLEFCVKHLTGTQDRQIPTLKRNRTLFSFKNGLYDAGKMMFHPYLPDGGIGGVVEGVAAKHFSGIVFDPYDEINDWRDIETPMLDHILEYQDVVGEAKDWMYILMGRMIYDINEFDNWQCAMYLKGYGGMYHHMTVWFVLLF